MRRFEDLGPTIDLSLLSEGELGSIHIGYEGTRPRRPRHLVRHFVDRSAPETARAFASMSGAAQRWLDSRDLGVPVTVQQPTEVGHDYVIRPWHVYLTSTRSYELDEDPPEAPPDLADLREAFAYHAARVQTENDALLARVLARNIVEPSGKTIYRNEETGFIIVDIKPTWDELDRWNS